jgi:hypothetical protein
MRSLRSFLERNAPYKSKEKYLGILDILLSHSVLQSCNFDLNKSINAAMQKILAPSNRKNARRCVVAEPVAIRSKRVLAMVENTNTSADVDTSSPALKRPRRTPVKKIRDAEDSPPPAPKSSRRRSFVPIRVATVTPGVSVTRRFQRAPHLPAASHTSPLHLNLQTLSAEERKFSFEHDQIFDDHDEIDPESQPWELLEPTPERNCSPKHYIHDGVVRQLDAQDTLLGTVRLTRPVPSPLSILTPQACRALPFPDSEMLEGDARMNPFPIEECVAVGDSAVLNMQAHLLAEGIVRVSAMGPF